MHDLMIHIERIVRPIRATQFRKLRMRRELLAHLQAAIDEELHRCPDEAAAIDAAKRRLGDPAELTMQLQRSVPLVERIILGRIPMPQRVEQCEIELGEKIYATRSISMVHQAILIGAAGFVAWTPWFLPEPLLISLTNSGSRPAHPAMLILVMLIAVNVNLIIAGRLMIKLSDPHKFDLPHAFWQGVLIIAMQVAWTFAAAAMGANRLASSPELLRVTLGTAVLLIPSILIARWVARLRRAYDDWLSLDIAG
jgi:hypothetical protein